jgi:hypothetical protein
MGGCLGQYFAGKLSISADTECSTMTVKKQKSLRRQSSWRLSHQVIPGHMHFEPQLKSPSFRDVYHISPCKTASKCKNEQAGKFPEVLCDSTSK